MQSVVESVNMEEPQIGGLTVGYMKLTALPVPPAPHPPLSACALFYLTFPCNGSFNCPGLWQFLSIS